MYHPSRTQTNMPVELNFGSSGHCRLDLDPARIVAARMPPPPLRDLAGDLRHALEQPLDFPPFARLFTPDDRVVLVVDRATPQADVLVAEVWAALAKVGIQAANVQILQPAGFTASGADPRTGLPDDVREQIAWKRHDPTDAKQLGYLATTARGERIYLARDLIEADVTVSIGGLAYDPVIGFRGTSSAFFPGLSSTEAVARAHGMSHSELNPEDERPLRQAIDEIAWLLGTLFTIQVIAGAAQGVSAVLAGAVESVAVKGRKLLAQQWLVKTDERVPIVVAAVDVDAGGHGWEQVGAALAVARSLVQKGGRVAILSQLNAEVGPGIQMIRDSRSPRNAIQPLRQDAPPDWIAATQFATAADWAHLYLMSQLPRDVVDSLFMIPLESERELQNLLMGNEECILLGGAQHAWGQVEA